MRGKPHLDRENMIIENLEHFKNRLPWKISMRGGEFDWRPQSSLFNERTCAENCREDVHSQHHLEMLSRLFRIGKLPTLKDEKDKWMIGKAL